MENNTITISDELMNTEIPEMTDSIYTHIPVTINNWANLDEAPQNLH